MLVSINPVNPMNTNVAGVTSVASMEINGFTFQALSGKNLYKNVKRAIIRELCCNALDSHVMADTEHTPFDVHLPTALEPYFSVRDYGTGLDDHGVRNVYLTYFKSTKRKDNTQIGAWGLGSKSPLGYTDNFTVTAIKDGVERIYSVFKNEDGIPAISIICENATDKLNGLEVRMAIIDDDDIAVFKREALDVLRWFNVKPNFNIEMNFEKSECLVENMGGNVNILYNGCNGSVVVHGNIAYSLDARMLNLDYNNPVRKLVEHGIELHMPNGSVEYAMSREELAYNPETINNIVSALEISMEDIVNKLAETIKVGSDFDAYIAIYSLQHKSFLSRENYTLLKKSGVSPLHELPIEHFNIDNECRVHGVRFMKKKHGRRGSTNFQYESMEWLYPTNVVDWKFMVNEEKNQSVFDKKVKYNQNRMSNKTVVIPADAVEKYSKIVFDKIGYEIDVVSSLSLDAIPKKVSSRSAACKDVVYRSFEKINISRSYYSNYVYRFDRTGTTVEPESDNKYYVALKNSSNKLMDNETIWNMCQMFNINTNEVFGVSETKVSKLSSDWVDVFDVMKGKTEELIEKFKKYGMKHNVSKNIMDFIDTIEKYDDVSLLRKATNINAMDSSEVGVMREGCRRFNMGADVVTLINALGDSIDVRETELYDKYVLLNGCDSDHCNFGKHMVEYIKMVNQL